MQTAGTAYQQLDASPSKRPDFLLAIAGWPTLYSVADDSYALSAGAHDLSSTNGFDTIRKWSDFPEISAAKMKGAFPESGGYDIGDMKVELLDKHDTSTTTRDLTDLLSRQARLEGNLSGAEYQLSATVTTLKADTTIYLVSNAGIVAGDVIHISQEAIKVGAVNGDGIRLTGCTRGYLLTNATQHEVGVKVYSYLPNLIWRPIWLYKGYRDLTLDLWLEAWGGLITSAHRSAPGKVAIQARSTTWAMWGGSASGGGAFGAPTRRKSSSARSPAAGVRRLVRVGAISDSLNAESMVIYAEGGAFDGDYRISLQVPGLEAPSGLDDGHYMIKVGDPERWFGIADTPFEQEFSGGDALVIYGARLVKGLGVDSTDTPVIDDGQAMDLSWSTAVFSTTAAPTGQDPIDLILRFLTSTGTGTNGAYDVFKKGIGLGVPVEQIDLTSFTAVQDQYDYGTLRCYFVFTESVDAKEFIDEELCRPFGWYIATGNDGRIKLVRPKNPAKLHFSEANNQFRFTLGAAGAAFLDTRQFTLPGGVYTVTEAATALQAGFRAVSGDSTLQVAGDPTQDIVTFDLSFGGANVMSFTLTDAWRTLGFTSSRVDDPNPQSDQAVALFTDSSTFGVQTVTKNDVHVGSAHVVPNGAARVGRVNFGCNYSWADDAFDYHVFSDAEIENLSPFGEAAPYEINSKGLLRAFQGALKSKTPWGVFLPPASGCMGVAVDVSSSHGIDASDSFATLFCEMLFDRYRNPPLRFKCKLKWRFNTLEIGDVLKVTHDVDGALIDQELGVAVVTARLFEVVGIRPVPAGGYVEVELLGHRKGG